jgi:hypothetical protein
MLLLASCASNVAQAPQEWGKAEKIPTNTCVNLSGTYINRAIEAPDNEYKSFHEENPRWSVFLSELLVPYIPSRDFVKHNWADTVKLNGIHHQKLEVILKKNGKSIFKKTLNEYEDFECSEDGVIIKTNRNSPNMMGITESFYKITVTKAIDGSILASNQKRDIGTIIVIPYTEKLIQRYKFSTVRLPE